MNQQHPRSGFNRPDFSPVPGGERNSTAEQPRVAVGQYLATSRGARSETTEGEEARLQERQETNRRRRRGMLIVIVLGVLVGAAIVAVMVWLWSAGVFLST